MKQPECERSMLSAPRLYRLHQMMADVKGMAGDTAEIGIAAGGTSKMIAACSGTHWAVDTFDGLQDVCNEDGELRNGMFRSSEEDVRKYLSDCRNIKVVKAFFPEDAPDEMKIAKYKLVHIDVDTYKSVKACFDFFIHRMVPGGWIALDDVKSTRCPGARKAWSEILTKYRFNVMIESPPQVSVKI